MLKLGIDVRALDVRHRDDGQDQPERCDVGAVLVYQAAAQAEDFRLGVDRDLEVPELVALLLGRDEVFAAVLDPLHRLAEPHRARGDERVFRIERALGAEAAAHVRRDHADLVLGEIEHVHEDALDAMRRLRGDVERVAAGIEIGHRNAPARLHREAAAAVRVERGLNRARGLRKSLVHVADHERHARDEIARRCRDALSARRARALRARPTPQGAARSPPPPGLPRPPRRAAIRRSRRRPTRRRSAPRHWRARTG